MSQGFTFNMPKNGWPFNHVMLHSLWLVIRKGTRRLKKSCRRKQSSSSVQLCKIGMLNFMLKLMTILTLILVNHWMSILCFLLELYTWLDSVSCNVSSSYSFLLIIRWVDWTSWKPSWSAKCVYWMYEVRRSGSGRVNLKPFYLF